MMQTPMRLMLRSRLPLTGFAFAMALCQLAAAQNNPPAQNLPEFRAEGTILALAPGGLLKIDAGEKKEPREGERMQIASGEWMVQVLPTTRNVRFTGSAKPDWLSVGLWVNFTTRFNKKGQALDPIKQLNVFTPGANRGPDVPQYQPGIKALTNPGAGISFAGEEKPKPTDDAALYEVTGILREIGKSGVSVLAGNALIQVPLIDDPTISVDIADLRPTRPGDKVRLNGRIVGENKGVATQVQVTSTEPLTAASLAAETKVKEKPTASKPTTDTTASTPESAPEAKVAGGTRKLPPLGTRLPTSGGKPSP